jgi:tetratricopeptide (TPR) repeat protein
LAPLTLIAGSIEAQTLLYAGQYEEALARLERNLELEPNFWHSLLIKGRALTLSGRYDEGIATLQRSLEVSGGSTESMQHLGYALAVSGRVDEALGILQCLDAAAAHSFAPKYFSAVIFCGLDEREKALDHLEASLSEREVQMTFIGVDSRWDGLRTDPRFAQIMSRMNMDFLIRSA